MFNTEIDLQSRQNLMFRLLVGYRWVSLLPPLIGLIVSSPPSRPAMSWWALVFAISLTFLLTIAATSVNRLLLRRPWLLVFDLLFSAGLVWCTGVEHSPYYLYSMAPILSAAFFFHIQGGLLAAGIYTMFYLTALVVPRSLATPLDIPAAVGQMISFFLIGAIFGYPALLFRQLHQTHSELTAKNSELSQRNRDLKLLQELSLVMQSSVDPAELQESILRGLVHEMGYRRTLMGLYDQHLDTLSSWITLEHPSDNGRPAQVAHTDTVSLVKDLGPLARALKGKQVVEVVNGEAPTASAAINERLLVGPHYLVLPLCLRGNSMGVILVDRLPLEQRLSAADRLSLDNLATHAGVALGSVQLCIDRAQRTAISEERHRIATELHDHVSQVLYGLAYGLEACIQLLAHEPDVQDVLTNLYATVTEAQARVRQVIFDMQSNEVNADAFVAGLHRRLRTICPVKSIALQIDLPGEFDHWEAMTRSHLYQVAHEALANTAKHADATRIIVKLIHDHDRIELYVTDDGQGFNPSDVDSSQHLGIQNMAKRIKSLNGTFEIISAPGKGTEIVTIVPYDGSAVVFTQ